MYASPTASSSSMRTPPMSVNDAVMQTPANGISRVGFEELPSTNLDDTVSDAERLNRILEEFDVEVESRIERMYAHSSLVVNELRRELMVELLKLPRNIKMMTLDEFISVHGCDISSVTHAQTEKVKVQLEKVKQDTRVPQSATRNRKTNKRVDEMENADVQPEMRRSTRLRSILADNNNMASTKPSSVKGAGKRNTATTVASEERRVTRARVASAEKTPAMSKTRSKVYATPAATPRFDSRLPQTPLVRPLRKGESILVSQNGSPISLESLPRSSVRATIGKKVGRNDVENTITLGLDDGCALQLNPDEEMTSEMLGTLSKKSRNEALSRLQAFQDQIAGLMSQLQ